MICSRCGLKGIITYGSQGLCSICRREDDDRDRSAYYERIARENAELEARRNHPAYWRRLHLLHGKDWRQRPHEYLGHGG